MQSVIFPKVADFTLTVSTSKAMSANNTTVSVPVFDIRGVVRIVKLYGIVTTTLGPNHTAAHFRLNDQTATTDITLAAGSTLSGFLAGAFLGKTLLTASALTVKDAAVGQFFEPTVADQNHFSPFIAICKDAVQTTIDYRYSTTDAPTSGQIDFFVEYQPLSANAVITAL